MARDFEVEPYDRSEARVAEWLSKGGVGGGDAPIGFLSASHEIWRKRFQAVEVPDPEPPFNMFRWFFGGGGK